MAKNKKQEIINKLEIVKIYLADVVTEDNALFLNNISDNLDNMIKTLQSLGIKQILKEEGEQYE